jgi:predicted RNase H-like HicB family nuclease
MGRRNALAVVENHMVKRTTDTAKAFEVTAVWDPEAGVWVAESNDIPGLVAEAETMDELVPELEKIIPALIAENHVQTPRGSRLDYHLVAHIKSSIDVPGLA